MHDGLSVADAMSLSKGNQGDGGLMGGGGIWAFMIFAIIFGGGGGGGLFGGRDNGGSAAMSQITNDFLYTNLSNSMSQGFTQLTNMGFQTQQAICSGLASTGNLIQQSNYETNTNMLRGFNDMDKSMNLLGFNMQQCCCEIKQAICNDGEKTRALITGNVIQELRDNLSDAKTTLSNAAQSQYLLGSVGKFYPYQGVNPCCGNNGCC